MWLYVLGESQPERYESFGDWTPPGKTSRGRPRKYWAGQIKYQIE